MYDNEIVLYQPNDSIHLEVRMEKETVWLKSSQGVLLVGRTAKFGLRLNAEVYAWP